jgi:hypothetical protein
MDFIKSLDLMGISSRRLLAIWKSGGCLRLITAAALVAVWPRMAAAVDPTDTFYGTGAGNGATTGFFDSAFGFNALHAVTTGSDNTAIGYQALFSNTTGSDNTASGHSALYYNTTGRQNTACGLVALSSNTTGNYNTASGSNALYSNTTGNYNVAIGASALQSNTSGPNNTANGVDALLSNTTGSNNLASGYQALYSNTTGDNNLATGALALFSNTTGFYNMANGSDAMVHNTAGSYNVAEGVNALRRNTTGSINTAVGLSALLNNTTGGANIALGGSAGSALTTGSYNINIGNVGVAAESGAIRIGEVGTQQATYIAGISGMTVAGGVTVVVDANGHLGTVVSSARFKERIKAMDKASEVIHALKPVTFRYKDELDPEGIAQFGLVAEEVEKVNPDLVARDKDGKVYTVRYEAVNAMLLNEFLKEHRKVEQLEATVTQQEKDFREEIKTLTASLKEQASQIQQVRQQFEIEKAMPRLVTNNQ